MNNQNANNNLIFIDETNFVYQTNLSGDPIRGYMGSTARQCNIKLNDDTAEKLKAAGCNVKQTPPHDEDPSYRQCYYIKANLRYRNRYGQPVKRTPNVYLVNANGDPVPLDEETVGRIDDISVKNVKCVLRMWDNGDGMSVDIVTMYVEQDMSRDPYAEYYRRRKENMEG